jgi:uncharacterized SAM-binding protein YcdF (DUF218 family)
MALRIISFIFMTFLTLALLWALGWMWFATTVALSSPDKKIEYSDAIIVLTGGNGRIAAGLDLLAQKKSDKLFISGVNEEVIPEDILNGRRDLCCVFLGYKAKDTVGNAQEIKEWVDKNDIKSFHLVTSSYHMPRAQIELLQVLPQAVIKPYPVLTPDFQPWKGRFYNLTFSEYNKTIISWLRLADKKE